MSPLRRRDFKVRFPAGKGAAKESEESMGEGFEGLEEEIRNRVVKEEDLGDGGDRNEMEGEKERDLEMG